jgi:DNA polymerase-4
MTTFGDLSVTHTWPQAILHLDMDAFYVNVHLLDHPQDAGLPLVIGGQPTSRGVVASASYEARQLGIRSAMPTSTAVRLCPALKIVPANWPRIRECSHQVMDILAAYGPVEQISVDEAYVDLSSFTDPQPLAETIRTAVKSSIQLPASVGLATSKLVAKVASDHEKPQGCTLVLPGHEAAFLAPLPVRVIWGIGPRAAEKLAALAIHTCGALATADMALLYTQFGRQAAELQQRALGIDERPVQAERGQPKSISQEWTFDQDVNDPARLREQLRWQADSVAQSLQKRSLVAHTIRVKFRWADFTTFTRQKSVAQPVDDAQTIYQVALAIWQEHWPPGQRMRLIGLGVTGLTPATRRQLGFQFGSETG